MKVPVQDSLQGCSGLAGLKARIALVRGPPRKLRPGLQSTGEVLRVERVQVATASPGLLIAWPHDPCGHSW